jgi:hypothetical protein
MGRDKVPNFVVLSLWAFCLCFIGACAITDKEQTITPVQKIKALIQQDHIDAYKQIV